jgi:peptide/nickel transport system substrate-binding protein
MIRLGQGLLAALLSACLLAAPAAMAQDRAEVVRIPFPEEEGTLTPYTFEVGYQLMTLIYDTIMWRDAGGVPRPWLAESVTRSNDGRQVTIKLRDGIRWQDGRPLTASDVGFTFDFVRTHPHPRFTPQLDDIELVEVVDERTVVITLRRPALGFFDQPLSDLPILPRHIWEGLPEGLLAPPGSTVGSGPYELVDRRPGDSYVFRANPDYFKGRPLVERIEVPIIRTVERSLQALTRQEVDMIPASLDPSIPAASVGRGIRVGEGDSYIGTVLLFNLRRPPFDDPGARRAVALALDPERIAAAVAGFGAGEAVAAENGYLHPNSRWAPDRVLQRFDPDAARVAVAEGALLRLTVLAPNNDPVRDRAGEEVVEALREVGAAARLQKLPFRRLAARIGLDRPGANFELAVWSAPSLASYDPSFLEAIFGSGSALNYGRYRSARFDQLAAMIDEAPTEEERREAVAAALGQLASDLPVVPLIYPEGAYAYAPEAYDGWVYVKGEGILDKRSFLPNDPAREPGADAPIGDPLDTNGSGTGGWVWIVVGALAVAIVAGFGWYAAAQSRR